MASLLKGRFCQKTDVEVNWNKAINFVPLKGEVCVYLPDDNNTEPRFKVGDGETTITNLPFAITAPSAISTTEIDSICK